MQTWHPLYFEYFAFFFFRTGQWYTAPVYFIPDYVLSLSYGVKYT